MSSRSEIRFNFREALNEAQQLEDLARRLEQLSGKTLENSIKNLAAAWKGNNATAFLRKEDALKVGISTTASDIYNIADDIRRIARRVYEAEMEALRIAQSRRS